WRSLPRRLFINLLPNAIVSSRSNALFDSSLPLPSFPLLLPSSFQLILLPPSPPFPLPIHSSLLLHRPVPKFFHFEQLDSSHWTPSMSTIEDERGFLEEEAKLIEGKKRENEETARALDAEAQWLEEVQQYLLEGKVLMLSEEEKKDLEGWKKKVE